MAPFGGFRHRRQLGDGVLPPASAASSSGSPEGEQDRESEAVRRRPRRPPGAEGERHRGYGGDSQRVAGRLSVFRRCFRSVGESECDQVHG